MVRDANNAVTRRSFLGMCAGSSAIGMMALLSGCGSQGGQEPATGGSSSSAVVGESSVDAAATSEPVAPAAAESATDIESATATDEPLSTTFFAFDTVITLTAYCTQEALDAAVDRCGYFESIFSRTIETSDIGRINAAQGASVQVAPETADIVAKALAYCEESGGLFDITIGAVSSLWDFKEGVVPDSDELAEAVKHVDYRCVQVEGDTITLADPDAKLDLGGIAKGYIADDLCELFAQMGCESGLVNLGGNVKTIGRKPDGRPWRVGIQDPNDVQGTVIAAVSSEGTSVVTSGLYERQFELDGQRYWHILDPSTGYPVQTDLVSASIMSDASIDGDGYTKPLFMMGCDEALAWINAHDGLEGLLVDMDGTIMQSDGCNAELL